MKVTNLFKSFKNAFSGIKYAFKNEPNFRIQTFVGFFVAIATIIFPLRTWEVVLVILMLMMVFTMELLNTALEYFTDLLKPRLNHYVFAIKDIMAAAVLVTALGAMIIGLIIFVPHFISLVK